MSPHRQLDLSSWLLFKASLLPKHKARQMAGGNKHQHGTSQHREHGGVISAMSMDVGVWTQGLPHASVRSVSWLYREKADLLCLFIFTSVVGDFIFQKSNHFKALFLPQSHWDLFCVLSKLWSCHISINIIYAVCYHHGVFGNTVL